MGFFKSIHLEILDWQAQGRSIEMEDLVAIWEDRETA